MQICQRSRGSSIESLMRKLNDDDLSDIHGVALGSPAEMVDIIMFAFFRIRFGLNACNQYEQCSKIVFKKSGAVSKFQNVKFCLT